MAQNTASPAGPPSPQRSRLVPVGVVLLLLGLLIPRPLDTMAQQMPDDGLKGLAFILTDVFRLCFFVGVACWIIGALRNRRWKKSAEVPVAGPSK
jgi:hypothetical protein